MFVALWTQESRLSTAATLPLKHKQHMPTLPSSLPVTPGPQGFLPATEEPLDLPKGPPGKRNEGKFDLRDFSLGDPVPSSVADLRRFQITDQTWRSGCFRAVPCSSALAGLHNIIVPPSCL